MVRKCVIFPLLLVLLSSVCLAAVSCGGGEPATDAGMKTPTPDSAVPPGTSGTVTMNGRSVMAGWMEHWGYDWAGPVEENGYYFDYKELDASDLDSLPSSFASNVEGLEAGSVSFFKFCFVDFNGDNLEQLERIIREVVETARVKDIRLIIGNALPVRRQDGSASHVSEYRQYNAFLERTASENPGIWIYDFYGELAGPDGFLKTGYDVGDSHLNEDAYEALDATFFPLLKTVYSESQTGG